LGIIVCVTRRGGNAIPSGRTASHKTSKPKAKITFKARFILTTKRDSIIVMKANKASTLFSPVLFETQEVQKSSTKNNVTVLARKIFPDIRNCNAFIESSYNSPACLSDTRGIKMKKSTADWWTEVTGENRSTRTEPVQVPHFPSQIPMDRPGSRTTPLRLLTARTMQRPRPARLQEAKSTALTDCQRQNLG